MVDFIDQKEDKSFLFLYNDSNAVFRATSIGDFGNSQTGQYSGPTFYHSHEEYHKEDLRK